MYDRISESEISAGRKVLMGGWGGRPNLIVTRIEGAKFWDDQGREYIDCTSQAFSLNLGALHPKVIEAAKQQMERMTHILYHLDSIPLLLLSKKIAEIAPGDLNRVSFCLEGSMASEMAMKLAMKNKPDRRYFVTFDHAFHGRSLSTIAASWVDPWNSFPYYMENIVRVPEAYCYRCVFGLEYPSCDLRCAQYLEDTIKRRVNGGVVGVMMEPVQGNGGQISFPPEFHKRVREICTKNNVLLIWDEVQTGFGRVGEMFAADLYDVVPDILIFGKGVAGGFPLAGIIARDKLQSWGTGENAFTFAHFTPSLVAALTTIEILKEGKPLERCRKLNTYIIGRLMKMKEEYDIIGDARGLGLAIGVELVKNRETKEPAIEEANEIVEMGLEKGVMFGISRYGRLGNVIKIKPPLVITDEEIEKVLSVLEKCILQISRKVRKTANS